MEGKKGKNELVVLTLIDRLSRYEISRKLSDAKSDIVQKYLSNITKENIEAFDSITFDNGFKFSQAGSLENEPALDLKGYFCHAYSAWERGTNEKINKLLREFLPKGKAMHSFIDKEVIKDAQQITNVFERSMIINQPKRCIQK